MISLLFDKSNWPTLAIAGATVILTSFLAFEVRVALASIILGLVMILITVSDARTYIIPDVLSLPMIPIGLFVSYLLTQNTDQVVVNIAAAVSGAASLYALNFVFRSMRGHDGLGLGDIKLVAAAGAWTGVGITYVVLFASLSAIGTVAAITLFGSERIARDPAIPFGMFLAPAIWLVWCVEQLFAI